MGMLHCVSQVKRFDDELGAGLAWEALYAAVNKTLARTQVGARNDLWTTPDNA